MKAQQSTNKDPREVTAYHEAGHAVAAACLGLKVKYVTIVPNESSTGHTMLEPEDPDIEAAIRSGDRWHPARFRAEKRVMVLLAGETARTRFDSRSVRSSPSRTDRRMVLDLLRAYAPAPQLKRELKPHIKLLLAWTFHLIWDNWNVVEAVANALLERLTLHQSQIDEVIQGVGEEQTLMQARPLLDLMEDAKAIRERRDRGNA
jgi:hypothetical protein